MEIFMITYQDVTKPRENYNLKLGIVRGKVWMKNSNTDNKLLSVKPSMFWMV